MLESRELHKAASYLLHKVDWLDVPNEWKHHGLQDELNLDLILSFVEQHCPGYDSLYLVDQRENSRALARSELKSILLSIIGQSNFFLWNLELTRVIEFQKMGVLRLGAFAKVSQ